MAAATEISTVTVQMELEGILTLAEKIIKKKETLIFKWNIYCDFTLFFGKS